jgi:hypothetical protein
MYISISSLALGTELSFVARLHIDTVSAKCNVMRQESNVEVCCVTLQYINLRAHNAKVCRTQIVSVHKSFGLPSATVVTDTNIIHHYCTSSSAVVFCLVSP